jgi:hypothetical protein
MWSDRWGDSRGQLPLIGEESFVHIPNDFDQFIVNLYCFYNEL